MGEPVKKKVAINLRDVLGSKETRALSFPKPTWPMRNCYVVMPPRYGTDLVGSKLYVHHPRLITAFLVTHGRAPALQIFGQEGIYRATQKVVFPELDLVSLVHPVSFVFENTTNEPLEVFASLIGEVDLEPFSKEKWRESLDVARKRFKVLFGNWSLEEMLKKEVER